MNERIPEQPVTRETTDAEVHEVAEHISAELKEMLRALHDVDTEQLTDEQHERLEQEIKELNELLMKGGAHAIPDVALLPMMSHIRHIN